ncbi:amidohydrolase family protein [Pedobacter sp. PF22-3]|uniref:amidohydrolase n=1 Tax=Pedobacter sp. PF22-3 TaxID=2994467 RepID=UPI00224597CB|nr:amidohydrolase family protein [Pedobacter sp. PF22-3]MCX2494447.1 amidohydrolase family protein [Pedobacter sp. PF22-3]
MRKTDDHHTHGCTCGCKNPIVEILKHELFSKEHIEKLTAHLPKSKPLAASPKAILYSGGTIRPMVNGDAGRVESIGIAEGYIIASGSYAHVKAEMDARYNNAYQSILLDDTHTLIPGMFEPHVHTVFSGMMASWIDVSPFEGQDLRKVYTKEWISATLSSALSTSSDSVLLATGLDPALIQPQSGKNFTQIDNAYLDSVSMDKPIIIMSASGHTIYANSAALREIYNSQKGKPAMHGYTSADDYIAHTHGLLEEEPMMMPAVNTFKDAIATKSLDIVENMDAFFRQANSRGVTSMYDALINHMYVPYLEKYLEARPLSVRLGGALYCETFKDAQALPPYRQPGSYLDLYLGHVKIVSDGSNQGLTGYQSEPYSIILEKDHSCGIFNFKNTEAYQKVVDEVILEKGWPIMIHANGNLAVTDTIAAFSSALAKYKGPKLRNRIEHCSLLEQNGIDEMETLNISPSFLIGHVGYWGDVFEKVIFEGQHLPEHNDPKVFSLDRCASAAKKLRISLHSDHTVTPLGPLRMMEQAITRVMEASENTWPLNVLNTEEQLTNEQALKAVTYDAAWQCYADGWAGSLEEGKFADFVILEQDPIIMTRKDCSMNMRNIKVLETWVGGIKVYPGS